MAKIVIIGNGIAGITTARHVRKRSDDEITVISGESDHFFSRTALMYIYMGHMKYEHTKPYEDWFWEKNNIKLKRGWVNEVDFDKKELKVENETIQYDKLVLALGSKPNKFNWPGINLKGVQSLYSLQDLEEMDANTHGIKKAVVVGGGLIGIEMAEMLHSRGIDVTYLVREKHFWDIMLPQNEAEMIERHIHEHGIDLRLSSELKEIKGDSTGRVQSVLTKNDEEIECQFVGLTIGVSPNIDLVKDSALETKKGIVVNEFLETNIPDVYAIGDCAEVNNPKTGRRAIEPVWYTGRIMGETLGRTLTGDRNEYSPGVWFNSAKFFDIEYQTYGIVDPVLTDNQKSFYWQNEEATKCLHFVMDASDRHIIGVNALGFRLRHELLDKWISARRSMDEIVSELSDANFDPELYLRYEPQIISSYNEQFGTSLSSKKKSWTRILNIIGK